MELDNILRGSDKARKGIITDSILSLVQWCKNIYFIEKFLLRVLSTNENAINFYKKLGFKTKGKYYENARLSRNNH